MIAFTMLSYSSDPKSTALSINFETGTVTDVDMSGGRAPGY
jgi:hypothetical protein